MLGHMNHTPRPDRSRTFVTAVSLSLLALGAAGCASDSDSSSDTSSAQPPTDSTVAATDPPTNLGTTTEAPSTTATTTPPAASTLTLAEADTMAATIIDAWNTDDVSPIDELMGPDDVWIAITGTRFDETTIAGWLDPILVAIGDTKRTGEPVAVTDGFSFPLVDVQSGGPFFLTITRSSAGVLTIEESTAAR